MNRTGASMTTIAAPVNARVQLLARIDLSSIGIGARPSLFNHRPPHPTTGDGAARPGASGPPGAEQGDDDRHGTATRSRVDLGVR